VGPNAEETISVSLSKRNWDAIQAVITEGCSHRGEGWVGWANSINRIIQESIDNTEVQSGNPSNSQPGRSSSKSREPGNNQYEVCIIRPNPSFTESWWEAWVGNSRIAISERYGPYGVSGLVRDVREIERKRLMDFLSNLLAQSWDVLTTDANGNITSLRRPKR